ncbi:MAG: SRPBCC family protein [Proteobacteria bacterium]|nr:SRPBCC family protein [Pseudomonadota bacterium]
MRRIVDGGIADWGERVIKASPQIIYRALLDPEAVAVWRAPAGMTCRVEAFDPREGGAFRLALSYGTALREARGKTSDDTDVVEGRFLELIPNERVVEQVEFVSNDPAFAGQMTIATVLAAVPDGTGVTIVCEGVPPGISGDDHHKGITSTLANLAAFAER